jgi:hypothetical protein
VVDHSHYEFPDQETLVRYLALLRRVLVDARARAYVSDRHVADLLDAIENIPDLLARWPDMDAAIVHEDLRRLEQTYLEGEPRYSGILQHGPDPGWQLRWKPADQ